VNSVPPPAVAFVAAGLAITACGAAESPHILNTEKIERSIERSSLAQRGVRAQVTCPSGVHQKKGLTFHCAALTGRGKARFAVTQLDGDGHVRYEGL
jgi:Domain of unknown function (DUF4333)